MASTSQTNISPRELNERINNSRKVGIYPGDSDFSKYDKILVAQNDITVAVNYLNADPPLPDYIKFVKKPGISSFYISSQGNIPIYAIQWAGGIPIQVQDVVWRVDVNINGVELFVRRDTNPPHITLTPIKA